MLPGGVQKVTPVNHPPTLEGSKDKIQEATGLFPMNKKLLRGFRALGLLSSNTTSKRIKCDPTGQYVTENGVPSSGNTHAVVGQSVAGRAPGWSGPSGVNNKQVQWTRKQNRLDESNPDNMLKGQTALFAKMDSIDLCRVRLDSRCAWESRSCASVLPNAAHASLIPLGMLQGLL